MRIHSLALLGLLSASIASASPVQRALDGGKAESSRYSSDFGRSFARTGSLGGKLDHKILVTNWGLVKSELTMTPASRNAPASSKLKDVYLTPGGRRFSVQVAGTTHHDGATSERTFFKEVRFTGNALYGTARQETRLTTQAEGGVPHTSSKTVVERRLFGLRLRTERAADGTTKRKLLAGDRTLLGR